MSFSNITQSEINDQNGLQTEQYWERRRKKEQIEKLADHARRKREQEARDDANKPITYWCTNLKCLVKLEQLSKEEYQCPSCKETFIKEWISVRSGKGIKATSDFKDELKRLEDYREKYLHEAREIKKKLQFLDEWEKMGLTQK